ncbi:6,7-dimethyl-8-ribityllumazine synthase [Candidatus Kapabacteria bacterium]|nr:6,7-dimethyl-8-ribityllumazine synthase [Candidatus Kapabacteria bacterium]
MENIFGNLNAGNKKFAIIVTRWNEFIVSKLQDGAIDAISRTGGVKENITIYTCPGSFEIPLLAKKVCNTKKYDAVIALGTVIRGATPHFDMIAAEVTKGLANVSLDTGVPISFGVLTTDTIEQAIERAGTKAGNKGYEAAMTAIEMIDLFDKI